MQIDHRQLSKGALDGVLESFIHRQDHEIFDEHCDIDQIKSQLIIELNKGERLLVYDEASESIGLLTPQEYQQIANTSP